MRDRKMIAIPILLIIALSVVGFAYALWWDYVVISGRVQMGAMSLVWDENELLDYTDNEGILPIPKDVGYASIYYDPASYVVDPHTLKGGYKTLIIEIYNAYPSYRIDTTTLAINNTGQIPGHFVGINITGYDVTDGEVLIFTWWDQVGTTWYGDFWDDVDGDGDLEPIINVRFVNFVSVQLDPCEVTKGQIDLHFKQDAEECHTYTFKVTILAVFP